MLTFNYTGARGIMTVPQVLTTGMVGIQLQLEFSPEWEGLAKTVVFSNGTVTRDVIFGGNPVTIPAEVLEEPLKELTVGVYGLGSGGKLVIPTIRARGPVILPGVMPSGDPSVDPTLPVWAQILAKLGDLCNLETETKENLVASINEIMEKYGKIMNPDKTLTLPGVAAEAKAVGDRFSQLEENVEEEIRELRAHYKGVLLVGVADGKATHSAPEIREAVADGMLPFACGQNTDGAFFGMLTRFREGRALFAYPCMEANTATLMGVEIDGEKNAAVYMEYHKNPPVQGGTHGGNVVNYGAEGDGAADDTEAFRRALADNRVVYVPGGTYKLSGELVIGDNCCLELSQDTVLEFTQTSGNCITLGMLSTLKGNHATVKVPYAFDGHVLHAYSNDHTDAQAQAVPPWSKWDPQWKSGRYVSDLNICKADSRGFHYAVNPGECKGTAVYISADNTAGLLTFMWGVHYTGLRIAGAFAYGIHAQNFNKGWLHEMRIDAFIDACEVGVCLEDCSQTYISAVIQPRRAYTMNNAYVPYAKHGIKLVRSKNTDLSGSRVWDWNATNTLWTQDNEYQHIAMYGDCSGTILNDFVYHSQGDTRKRIYSDTKSNLDQLTVLQEPIDRWFKIRNGDPYYSDGFADRKLVTQEILDEHFATDVVKNFTDVLPAATDADGAVFGEAGYKWGYLLGNGNFTESAYYMTTGFIPLKVGQTLYVEGITYTTYDGLCRVCAYDANKKFVSVVSAQNVVAGNYYYIGYMATANGFAISLANVVGNADVAFVRLSAYKRNVSDNPMASIDEPIKYTVEGFLADGVKVKGENVIGTPGQVTPDWVATKKLEGGDTIVIAEQTLTSGLWSKRQSDLQPGIIYDVYINGVSYACECRHDADGAIYLGNGSLVGDESTPNNNEPFCILWYGGSAATGMFQKDSTLSYPITLKVTDHAGYVYNKMPEGYLPECVVRSVNGKEPDADGNVAIETSGGGSASIDVTAAVGQTIVVEAVDASGKPTKWKAADYQPRTHWKEEGVVFEYTGGLDEGCDVVEIPKPPILTIGETYRIVYNGAEYSCEVKGMSLYGGTSALGNLDLAMGTGDTGEPFVMAITDAVMMIMPLDGSESITLSIVGNKVIPIPAEYVTNAHPYYIDIAGEGTTESPWVCWDTVASVQSAFASGREAVVRVRQFDAEGFTMSESFLHQNIWVEGDYGKILYFLGFRPKNSGMVFVIMILVPNEDGTYTVEDVEVL